MASGTLLIPLRPCRADLSHVRLTETFFVARKRSENSCMLRFLSPFQSASSDSVSESIRGGACLSKSREMESSSMSTIAIDNLSPAQPKSAMLEEMSIVSREMGPCLAKSVCLRLRRFGSSISIITDEDDRNVDSTSAHASSRSQSKIAGGTYAVTDKTKIKRYKHLGTYDREVVYAILDEALMAHVAFVKNGVPMCLPMTYGRLEETLYLHGAITNAMLKTTTQDELDVCVTVTLLDGLQVARSAFHHSMNYRSVCAFGKARPVKDLGEKLRALDCITEHVLPGRTNEIRPNSKVEINATLVLALELEEVSAKVSKGGPADDEKDYRLEKIWAGELPFAPLTTLEPIDDARLLPGIPKAESIINYRRHKE